MRISVQSVYVHAHVLYLYVLNELFHMIEVCMVIDSV